MIAAKGGRTVSPSIPSKKKEKYDRRTYYLPITIIEKIDEIAASETEIRKGTEEAEEISANWVVETFLRWAIDDHNRLKQGAAAKAKK